MVAGFVPWNGEKNKRKTSREGKRSQISLLVLFKGKTARHNQHDSQFIVCELNVALVRNGRFLSSAQQIGDHRCNIWVQLSRR